MTGLVRVAVSGAVARRLKPLAGVPNLSTEEKRGRGLSMVGSRNLSCGLTVEGPAVKRYLQVLVAESEDSRFLRDRVPTRRRIRYAATEQECLDLGYAGAGDVMLVDIEAPAFSDPDFVNRVRFVSRSAFPILGVASENMTRLEKWLRAGLSEILYRETLTPYLLDRALRHWVKHQRLQMRLFDANRRALRWWKDLVSALDEIRLRMEKSSDSLTAFLTLLETGEGEAAEFKRRTLGNARKQVAEINQLAQELDLAARSIQLEGIEKDKTGRQRGHRAFFTDESLADSARDEERQRSIHPSATQDAERHRRYGT